MEATARSSSRLRGRSVRGSTLDQLNCTTRTLNHQESGPSLGDGWEIVAKKIDHLHASLHRALHRMEEKQQKDLEEKLEKLAEFTLIGEKLEDVLSSLRHRLGSEFPLDSPCKPPEVSPRFAELPVFPFAKSQESSASAASGNLSGYAFSENERAKSQKSRDETPNGSVPSVGMNHVLSVSVGKKIYPRSFLQRSIWTCLEDGTSSHAAWCYGLCMNCFILLSVFLSLFQVSFPSSDLTSNLWLLDFAFDIVFAVDLLVRLMVWPAWRNFFINIYNLIDMSVMPSLIIRAVNGIQLNANDGLWSTILLCFFPVLRLLKLLRRFQTFQVLLSAWWAVFEALPMLIFVLTIIAMTFASLLFVCEPRSNIPDWPTALWLTVVSMTGLGYGDLTPATAEGKIFVSILIVTSLLYLSIPFGILGSAFTLAWTQRSAVLAIRKLRKHLAGHGFTSEDVPKMLEHFDLNHDSQMSLVEFRTMINDVMIGLRDREVIDLFECLDLRHEGFIRAPAFLAILFPRSYEETWLHPLPLGPKHRTLYSLV